MEVGTLLLLVGGVLAASIVVALGAARAGVPSLVAFLALGMLLGSDGPGGIEFDDAELARTVGIVGLAAILYEGGLSTSWRRLREVAVPAALLSTVGVVVTALLTGVAAHDALRPLLARGGPARRASSRRPTRPPSSRRCASRTSGAGSRARSRRETGLNDPIAIALTIGLIDWIEEPTFGFADLAAPDRAAARARPRGRRRARRRRDVGLRPPAARRSERSRRSRRSRPRRSRSASPTSSAAAASSRSTSSASPSAAPRRAIAASSSRSTRGLRSSRR